MLDEYKQSEKVFRMIRALYEQRKSSLLWLRTLTVKCFELELKPIQANLVYSLMKTAYWCSSM
jgi:hypothetical protein